MTDDFVPQLTITRQGTELPEEFYDALTEARADCSVQLPDQIRLQFTDPDFDLYDQGFWEIGDRVVMAVTSEGRPRPIADCQVTSIGIEPAAKGSMTLTITALGLDHRLYRGVRLAVYADQTDSEIVSSLASEFGLTSQVSSSSIRHAHVMQAGPTNRFLDERAQLIGFRWWVEGETLHFNDSAPADDGPTLSWGEDLISLRVVSTSADVADEATVRSWNPDTQQAITTTSRRGPTMAELGTDAAGPVAAASGARRLHRLPRFNAVHPAVDVTSASAMADGICQRSAATEVVVRGVAVGDPLIKAGSTITIDNAGRRLSGRYRLASVEHVYTADDGYITRFASGGQDATGFVDLLRSAPSPPPWNPHALVIGVVTNVDDPQRPARVKVNFPTFDDNFESAWARLVLPGAGPGRGLQIYPEIDDEVLVGFENGDPGRPLVLGGMWSQQLAPPMATAEVVRKGVIGSRSWTSRSGHSVTINDAEAAKPDSIVVALKDGKTVLTLAADGVTLTASSAIKITTAADFSLNAAGDVVIEGRNVTVKAATKMQLDGADIAVKATGPAAFRGAKVDIKADAALALDGGGMTEIKGGMVKLN